MVEDLEIGTKVEFDAKTKNDKEPFAVDVPIVPEPVVPKDQDVTQQKGGAQVERKIFRNHTFIDKEKICP